MAKLITVQQALDKVYSGCHIITSMGACEPQDFLSGLSTIADKVSGVTITNCLPLRGYDYSDIKYKDSFFCESLFYSPVMRKAHEQGISSYIPNHLHQCGVKRNFYRNADIFVGAASLPDKHGYVSLSLSNIYEKRSIENAGVVILEVNPNVPRTFGDVEINLRDIDYIIESNYALPTLPAIECTDKDMSIGRMIAERIDDGDCIQLGIGGIPNAVAKSLMEKKDLGVHTEMLTTGIMDLAKAGVVTGKHKQIHKDRIVTSFVMGSKELYDFVDDNPSVRVFDCNYVNDPDVIARNDNQVSINTTMEVDLTGQCCSEALGSVQYSGTGGQADTVMGAQKSRGGRSFIALYSTANAMNRESGEREEASKIVSRLRAGAAVSLSRNDVEYVVTEYGSVCLKGASIRERAKMLISIAHPKFRESLTKEAYELGLLM
ncbi:MAG: 4-hydroxybutyrate--acetyl-CoA CoA transferase [Clostridia bacterium]|nr:4-hydroxybutyrate--acetyl-CoA CoA transferase [Clostridia bacterium]